MKIIDISTTEEMVMNPKYAGWRYARIEVDVEGEHYPVEVGYIKVWKDDLLFESVRDKIEQINSNNL